MYKVINGQRVFKVPDEYIDYIFCKKFGWTIEEVNNLDDRIYNIFLEIMEIEADLQKKELKKIKKWTKKDTYKLL